MFAFVFAVGFSDGQKHKCQIQSMSSAMPFSPTDGIKAASTEHSAAAILRWNVVARDNLVSPRWDNDRQILFAGDVRLYNRPEMIALLGLVGSADENSDLDLAGLAYLRWGEGALQRLVGDFAFVAWHERDRILFAARDHLGVRPLFYRATSDGVLLASDVRQILAVTDEPYRDVNPEAVLQRFVFKIRHHGLTYFRGISELRPGHYLRADSRKHEEQAYWLPPASRSDTGSYEENCVELLRLFRRAVTDRLDSRAPIIAHSSGGFDASTIIFAADEAYRTSTGRPPIILASAMTKGWPCDDSEFMDVVDANAGFEGTRWNALEPGPVDSLESSLAQPGFLRGLGGGDQADLDLAAIRGAKVLLAGVGGDNLLHAQGIFADLFRHGYLVDLWRAVRPQKSIRQSLRLLVGSMLGVFSPGGAHRIRGYLTSTTGPPPGWLGPALREIYPSIRKGSIPSGTDWTSHVQMQLWARVTGAGLARSINAMVQHGAERGLEVRLPFVDKRIVEHLLAMPWRHRLPAGHLRQTGRDALGRLLPPQFDRRVGQGSWSGVWEGNAYAARSLITRILQRDSWLSAPFVDRRIARDILSRANIDGPELHHRRWSLLLDFAAVESWLRKLICYNPAREENACPTN